MVEGTLLDINGEVSDLETTGVLSAAAIVARPLMEKLILFFSRSACAASSSAVFGALGADAIPPPGAFGVSVFRFFRALSSSARRSAGGLKGLSSSSGSGNVTTDFG